MKNQEHTQKSSFKWLNATQFLGAFNDNFFKLLVIFALIAIGGAENVAKVSALCGALFVLPFLIFSPLSGVVTDRFDRVKLVRFLKISEFFLMGAGSIALYFSNTIALYSVLFLMSAQSAFFGPAKIALLPALIKKNELSRANGYLVMCTFLAIIAGNIGAALASDLLNGTVAYAGLLCMVVAIVGIVTSFLIRRKNVVVTKVNQEEDKGYWSTVIENMKKINLVGFIAASGIFMFIASSMQIAVIPFGMNILNLTREMSSYLFIAAALGIGLGGFLAGLISKREPKKELLYIGMIGLAISSILIWQFASSIYSAWAFLFVAGFFGGLFIVPVNTLIQLNSPVNRRGVIMSFTNSINFVFILLSSAFVRVVDILTQNTSNVFMIIGAIAAVSALAIIAANFKGILKALVGTLIRMKYRFNVYGDDQSESEKPVLYVCSHFSWLDGFLFSVAVKKDVRFLMARDVYDRWYVKPLMKLLNVIPVHLKDGPKSIVNSLNAAREALDNGESVCIFPEGQISKSGKLNRFKSGYEKIVKDSDYKIVPAHIEGSWGSNLSYYGGKLFSAGNLLKRRNVSVVFGKSLDNNIEADECREKVLELISDTIELTKNNKKSLVNNFVRKAKRNPFDLAATDTTGKSLTNSKALTASIIISKLIKKECVEEDMVGVLLPASVGGMLVNTGCALAGKVPVNINFTSSAEVMESSVNQCNIKTVITSKNFVRKLKRDDLPGNLVYLEDLMKNVTTFLKLSSLIESFVVPSDIITNEKSRSANDIMTIIFSSGSTNTPKGVVLTDHNIQSNVNSLILSKKFTKEDGMCAALPFFHSFGYTATIWFPLIAGFKVSYHPNPLEGDIIAKVVREMKSTILMATPTFLKTYTRKAKKDDFETLNLVVVGAEKLRKEIAENFTNKFGIRPMEGYGATELSPVVSLNLPDMKIDGKKIVREKEGTVGTPLYGVAAKVVDPETYERVENGKSGMLLIKGPNVMAGYLNNSSLTSEVIIDGWYVTGDIAVIDKDGYITLTDRLSRFSKLGGEMVPHGAIEDIYLSAINSEELTVAVTAVPDEKRGEKIYVLYVEEYADPNNLKSIIKSAEIPNLWKPQADAYIAVKEIPLLGTGKRDLKSIKTIALEYHEHVTHGFQQAA